MNSYERVMAALERREPDRVPVAEMFVNKKFITEHFDGCDYLEFPDRADLDIAMVLRSGGGFTNIGGNQFQDRWGTIYVDTGEEALHESRCPIESRDDLVGFEPPDFRTDPRLEAVKTFAERYKGKRAVALQVSDSFSRPRKLLGMENLLMSYLEEPEFVHEVIEMAVNYTIGLIELAVECGADIIVSSDDYAGNTGPFMSPGHFEEFVLPGLTRLVGKAHEMGAKYIKHTDGDLRPIFEPLLSSGIDGIHPIEEYAGMDIRKVKREYGDRVCIVGSVDCRELLCEREPEEVEENVKEFIRDLGPGGGYMVASSNSIHSGVTPRNFLAMVEATKKYGAYPIAL